MLQLAIPPLQPPQCRWRFLFSFLPFGHPEQLWSQKLRSYYSALRNPRPHSGPNKGQNRDPGSLRIPWEQWHAQKPPACGSEQATKKQDEFQTVCPPLSLLRTTFPRGLGGVKNRSLQTSRPLSEPVLWGIVGREWEGSLFETRGGPLRATAWVWANLRESSGARTHEGAQSFALGRS